MANLDFHPLFFLLGLNAIQIAERYAKKAEEEKEGRDGNTIWHIVKVSFHFILANQNSLCVL